MSGFSEVKIARTNGGRHLPTDFALNDEIYGFHPGGVNALFDDGSVRFLKESVNILTQRSLITPGEGEVVSADAY